MITATAKGSQLQVRIYVNRRSGDLSRAVTDRFPTLVDRNATLCWTAPLEEKGFTEPQDKAFLDAVGLGDLAPDLKRFWPTRGPVWDGLAVAMFPEGRPGVVLAEGKSYPKEAYGGGCKATSPAREQIASALETTQRWFGIPEDAEAWMGSLYQSANRYAHLYWLRKVLGVEAWLVHLLFLDDATHEGATREQWEAELPRVEQALGLSGIAMPYADHAFLPAVAADELTRLPVRA